MPRLDRFPRASLYAALLPLLLLALPACDLLTGPQKDGTIRVRPQLIRIDGGGAQALGAAGGGAFRLVAPLDGSTSYAASNLEVIAFEAPIYGIWLMGSDGGPQVYECPPEIGCLVNLAGVALQDLLGAQPVEVQSGSYTSVAVAMCAPGDTAHTAYLTASGVLGGTTYYTKASGPLSTEAPAEPMPILRRGCGHTSIMQEPITIDGNLDEEGQDLGGAIPLHLFFDFRGVVWMGSGPHAWLPGFCSLDHEEASSGAPFLCAGYADVAGVLGGDPFVQERYLLNDYVLVGLYFSGTGGAPIGGYLRRWFDGEAPHQEIRATGAIQEMIALGGSIYELRGNLRQDTGEYEWRMPAFQFAPHAGHWFVDGEGPYAYTAQKLPD